MQVVGCLTLYLGFLSLRENDCRSVIGVLNVCGRERCVASLWEQEDGLRCGNRKTILQLDSRIRSCSKRGKSCRRSLVIAFPESVGDVAKVREPAWRSV